MRRLALLKTVGQHEYYRYLLRHVVVRAAKAGLLQPKDHKGVSLVSLARSVTDRLDCVRPDLPNTDDRILDSICQFDVLAALAAIADHGGVDTKVFYTSFAYYFAQRSEPIIELLLEDPELRKQIFPGPMPISPLLSCCWIATQLRKDSVSRAGTGTRVQGFWSSYAVIPPTRRGSKSKRQDLVKKPWACSRIVGWLSLDRLGPWQLFLQLRCGSRCARRASLRR